MANTPDWTKRGVIAAWVLGVPTLFIAILSYVRPADPAHPMSFDFLSRAIVLPPWLAVLIVLGTVVVTSKLTARYIAKARRTTDTANLNPATSSTAIRTAAPRQIKQDHPAEKTSDQLYTLIQPDSHALMISTSEHVDYQIKPLKTNEAFGLGVSFDNNRLDAIHKTFVTIYSAQSFDAHHNAFRANSFNAARIDILQVVQPSNSVGATWFVRKHEGHQHLQASNDFSHELEWPANDKSAVQTWLLNIGIDAQRQGSSFTQLVPLKSLKLLLIIRWDTETDQFFVAPYDVPESADLPTRNLGSR